MSLSAAAQEAMALKYIFNEINMNTNDSTPIVIYEDNQGAIAMSLNPSHYSKTKHIHIRHHFIREKVEDNNIQVKYISTENMLADMLTKALPYHKFIKFRNSVM